MNNNKIIKIVFYNIKKFYCNKKSDWILYCSVHLVIMSKYSKTELSAKFLNIRCNTKSSTIFLKKYLKKFYKIFLLHTK